MSPRPLLLLALAAAVACSDTQLGDAATANIVDTVRWRKSDAFCTDGRQHNPRALPAKSDSPEMPYLFVLTHFIHANRYPLRANMLYCAGGSGGRLFGSIG